MRKTTRLIVKTICATIAVGGVLGALGGAMFAKAGWYNIGALAPHWQFAYTFLEYGMHESVRHHASAVVAPAPPDAASLRAGAALYKANCVACHGGPGVPMANFAKSMQPSPGPLVDAARRWSAPEMYWIVQQGIKTSGMPAWKYHMSDAQIWQVVGFLSHLPRLSPQQFAVFDAGVTAAPMPDGPALLAGDALRGKTALGQYACQSCHLIPGVTGSKTYVGPQLASFGRQNKIAGQLVNSQANLVRWITDPKGVDPATAMPDLDVAQQDAVDMAAYLATLN
ncbi:c-type cytochrome [Massilia sp. S19_KUP03_FR1]|uniref:c-type cytochrome n=1 Tax=Massilia sp. S19_KUP03_FR1 TaxID=3025503 RepID=UPI002FCD4D8F